MVVLPPRRKSLLQRPSGGGLSEMDYAWPFHTEDYRSMIEQRARDYFDIAPAVPVHPNAWASAQRHCLYRLHEAEQAAAKAARAEARLAKAAAKAEAWVAKEAARVAKAMAKGEVPKPPKARVPKVNPHKLPPQFNRDWDGHTDEFREEVAEWARHDRNLPPGALIGLHWWKVACNRHYELTDRVTKLTPTPIDEGHLPRLAHS
jgi:hypothetical protein